MKQNKNKVREKIEEMFNAFKSEEAMYQVISVVEYQVNEVIQAERERIAREIEGMKKEKELVGWKFEGIWATLTNLGFNSDKKINSIAWIIQQKSIPQPQVDLTQATKKVSEK